MKTNEGVLDRGVRLLAGAGAIAAGALMALPFPSWIAFGVGAILVVTSVTGFCPAYRLLGVRTCKVAN